MSEILNLFYYYIVRIYGLRLSLIVGTDLYRLDYGIDLLDIDHDYSTVNEILNTFSIE